MSKLLSLLALAGFSFTSAGRDLAAQAETSAPFTSPMLTLDASALPPASTSASEGSSGSTPGFLSFYFENDGSFVRPGGSDKHYTNGIGFSVAGQPAWARSMGRFIPSFWDQFNPQDPHTSFAVGFTAAQDMYTPSDLSQSAPIYGDRPYAGWLYAGLFWQRASEPVDSHATMEHLQLDVGAVGDASLAEQTQKFIHANIATNAVTPEGWDNQLGDEIGVNLTYLRKWRFDVTPQTAAGMPAFQIIPKAGATLGTIYCNAQADLVGRIGWNLPDDFGPGRLHEMAAFTRQTAPQSPFGFYIFGRAAGQVVAHNTFLQGNTFEDSTVTVDPYPVVGEFQGGVAFQFCRHMELVYSQTMRTKEFHGQYGWDGYGALGLTFSWNF